MAEPNLSSPSEAVPGTPGIKEIRFEAGSECLNYGSGHGIGAGESPSPRPGIRKVSLRAEIDTSPPFGSVMEAVTRFGGHGPWINPLYKFGDNYNGDEEFDIKRVEEQTAELEKDLIVKELETLDVLEELTTTKRIVEELKRELQKEALKCLTTDHQDQHNFPSPHIKEMNNNGNTITNKHDKMINIPISCPTSSPDLILMELKRAKMNLGKTITDLGVIQNSVDCLTKKMRKEKEFIEKTRERLTSKFAGTLKPDEPPSSKPDSSAAASCMKTTAEMRWVAAQKMGEAAKAAEAVALAEINALSSAESPAEFPLSEPDKMSFNFRVQPDPAAIGSGWSRQRVALADAMLRIDEAHASKVAVMRKLREASEEVKLSRRALEEALGRVDLANRKQLAAEEAVNRWMVRPEAPDRRRVHAPISVYNSPRINAFSQLADRRHVDYRHADGGGAGAGAEGVGAKPVLKTTVSMRDVLSKKQVAASEREDVHYGAARTRERNGNGHGETHKVALSDMLQALRDDLNFPSKAEKDGHGHHVAGTDVNNHNLNHTHNHHLKQFWAQRKKFGFIQISLPLSKPSKKKNQSM